MASPVKKVKRHETGSGVCFRFQPAHGAEGRDRSASGERYPYADKDIGRLGLAAQ